MNFIGSPATDYYLLTIDNYDILTPAGTAGRAFKPSSDYIQLPVVQGGGEARKILALFMLVALISVSDTIHASVVNSSTLSGTLMERFGTMSVLPSGAFEYTFPASQARPCFPFLNVKPYTSGYRRSRFST